MNIRRVDVLIAGGGLVGLPLGLALAPDAPQALALAEDWRPWRSYAVIALWRALESSDTSSPRPVAGGPPPTKRSAAATPPVPPRRKALAKESR